MSLLKTSDGIILMGWIPPTTQPTHRTGSAKLITVKFLYSARCSTQVLWPNTTWRALITSSHYASSTFGRI